MPPKKRLEDVDAAARAHAIKILAWTLPAGITGGLAIPYWLSVNTDWGFPLILAAVPVCWALTTLTLYLVTQATTTGVSTGIANALIMPTSGAPKQRDYSYEESLVARGELDRAAAAYEAAALDHPGDPEPRLRLARLQRDGLKAPEEALPWFRLARELVGGQRAREVAITREIVELYTHRLGAPARALPELARAAQRWDGTPDGEWARAQLGRWKEEVHGTGATGGNNLSSKPSVSEVR